MSLIINPYRYVSGTAGYLDGLATTPRFAISIRKMVSTATVAIRVRRSSDNAEQDIGFTGTALDTTSLASFASSNSCFVTKMYDQTGNGFDAVQATSANQPRIVNAGTYDGKVVFDGSNDYLKVTAPTNNQPQAGLYTKAKQSIGGTKVMFETSTNYNSNAGSFVVYADTSFYGIGMCESSGSTGASAYSLAMSTMKQLTVHYDRTIVGSNEIKPYINGSLVGRDSGISIAECTGSFQTYDLYIGGRGGSSLFADMDLDTLVFYNADTASLRTSIEAVVA